MKLQKSLRIAVNIIFHSKLRSWLTIIGIVIGVAAIIAIISVGSGFQKDIQKQLGGLGSDIIYVTPGFDRATNGDPHNSFTPSTTSTEPLTDKELQAIKSVPDVGLVDGTVSGSATSYYLGKTAKLTISGVDPAVWKLMTTSTLREGRLLNSGDTNSIVIGSSVADSIFKNKVALNRQIKIEETAFTVVGILKQSGGFGADDKSIIMPIKQARLILGKEEKEFDAITVKVKDANNVDSVVNLMEKKLLVVRHVTEDTKNFTILSMKSIQEKVAVILAGFTLFLAVIAAVSLLVGAVGIANTMFTSVLERTKEIGIMKALGAKNADILLIFLFNSGLVGLVGGIIGVLFGVGIAMLIPLAGVSMVQGGAPISTSISSSLIIFTLVFSVVLGMISGAIPAYRASKLKPVDALRSE